MWFSQLLFASFVPIIFCSGYLELHLQSRYKQSASVNISSSEKSENSIVIPVVLKAGEAFNVTRIPVNFDRIYNITVKCGKSEEEGLTETTIVSSVTPRVGLLSPAAVVRPLNGMKITVRCDKDWFGEKCDVFCDEKKASKSGKICNFQGKLACSGDKTGQKCEKKINPETCDCQKNGKCIDSIPKPICECTVGFNGEKCDKKSKSASLSSHYKGDFWNFRMTFWQMIFSNLVENQLAEVKESSAWDTINNLLGLSSETPFSNRPNNTVSFPMTGSVDLSSISEDHKRL